jgi:hypothetical protein
VVQALGLIIIVLILALMISALANEHFRISVQFDIGVLLTAVLAFTAIYAVYLSYRYRPTTIEVLRDHTNSLRTIAKEWEASLPKEEQLPEIPDMSVLFKQGASLDCDIEKRALWADLIKNHLPPELRISESWQDAKQYSAAIWRIRGEIWNYLFGLLTESTGLSYGGNLLEDGRFTENLVRYTFGKIVERNGFPGSRFPDCIADGRDIVLPGSVIARTREGRDAATVLQAIAPVISSDATVPNIRMVLSRYIHFRTSVNGLRTGLQDLQLISLLPGTCKYMKSP